MKKFISAVLILVAIATLAFALVGCDKKAPVQNYTVAVTCDDEEVLGGVTAKLQYEDGTDASQEVPLIDGIAKFKMTPATYKVVLVGLREGYTYEEAILTATTRTVSISVEEEVVGPQILTYKVTLKLPNNQPIAETPVQLCGGDDGACHFETTDANGVATFELLSGTYEVHVEKAYWPENYMFDNDIHKMTAQSKEQTLLFEEYQDYTITVKFEAGKDDEGHTIPPRGAEGVTVYLNRQTMDGVIAGSAEGVTGSNGSVVIKASKTATYLISLTNLPEKFNYEEGALVDGPSNSTCTIKLMEQGLNIRNRLFIEEGTTTVNVTAKQNVWYYQINHKGKAGIYSIRSTGGLDIDAFYYCCNSGDVGEYPYTLKTEDTDKQNEDEANGNYNFSKTVTIYPENLDINNNIHVLKVVAKNTPDPIGSSFNIEITCIRELHENNIPTTIMHATQAIAPANQPAKSGTFTYLKTTDTVVYNSEDGFFHLGTENGAIIYASITSTLFAPRPFDSSFLGAYNESAGIGFVFSDGLTYIYNYTQIINEYALSVNEDGMHPLTEELQVFFQLYATFNHNTDLIGWDYYDETSGKPADYLYYFACGYYQ